MGSGRAVPVATVHRLLAARLDRNGLRVKQLTCLRNGRRYAGGEERFDDPRPVDGGAVPDDQQLAGQVREQVAEEADDVGTAVGTLLDAQEELAGGGDGADGGEVVAGERDAQDRPGS